MTDDGMDLTRDETLRALAALEASWRHDDQALEALGAAEEYEQPLPVLLADYGHRTLRALLTIAFSGGTAAPEEMPELTERMRDNAIYRLSEVLGDALEVWGDTADSSPAAAGHIGRTVMSAIVAVSQSDTGEDILPLLAALRAHTLQDRA
ncbi:hypothetical protein E6W39_37715 [Kitasatospora acidiphila]|uniref:Uncharacterized protein n=1 Tax=Kitasatospora acidiphila TaxID=2567942 RepID=A0A540WEQ5_9ACTN|nr:hypothetical protein [Kitasatospora acidiphila]TQF06884.1 hypothetical protein E6W39_37715 [Kitasatospora acidiphila]